MAEDPEELKRSIDETRRKVGRDVDVLTEKVSPRRVAGRRVDRARSGVHRLRERVMGSAESVGGTTGSAVSSVQEAGSRVGDAVASAPDAAMARTRGTPLAAGVIAFAAGWVVAASLPASAKEREVAHEAMDAAGPVKEQAAEIAQEVKENLQGPAMDAVDQVKQSASQAAGEVADEGRSAAEQVAGDAKQSADSMRQPGGSS
jgi:Protein of unknown function (DUF3618)